MGPNLKAGDAVFFAHGFNIHYGYVSPPTDVDVAMVAPKAPGHTVRWQYEAGQGTPVLVAVAQDATGKAWDLVRSYAKAIGGTKAGALVTTFKEETAGRPDFERRGRAAADSEIERVGRPLRRMMSWLGGPTNREDGA